MSLAAQLARALAADAPHEDEADFGAPEGGYREAAVLVPITRRAAPGVILTQRPEWLRSHAGQVAFPGGKLEPEDEHNAVSAALREAEEELAIPPAQVEVIGTAEPYLSGSGFRIVPVIALVPPDLDLTPCPDEVADWFEVPLAWLLDRGNAERKTGVWRGASRTYYDMDWHGRRIWGVTAGIIANLSRRLTWDQ
ncbi:CoA pyrophosphatase [Novosphingopyxis sp.]|uniref:CoA pyrophosphatase n=1 Tax=Novosphingopyxis sp. TaxID=2709690 RepID=UPI003B59935B